jgi:hypothetical protein
MGLVLALLPSPLLGPAVWRPAAEELVRLGWPVVTPGPGRAPRSPGDVLRAFLAALPADRGVAVIAHSNAGVYVPALTAERSIIAYVFVDAGLPASHGPVPLAPPAHTQFLGRKADQTGLLPPWTHWWDEADVAALFPSATVREQVEREQQRLPLSYFTQSLPVPPDWDGQPGGYLAFGDTYAADRDAAASRGWPVTTLCGGHLHMLIDPPRVAAELNALLTAIGVPPPTGESV